MIVASLKKKRSIVKHFPCLKTVFDFICSELNKNTKDGRYEVGFGIYAVVEKSFIKKKSEQLLESHKKYVDFQYVICGKDKIGWKFLDKSFIAAFKYDRKKDLIFFKNKPDIFFELKKDDFVIFFPQDAHAPLCGKTAVKKCVFKIPKKLFQDC